MTRSTFTLGPSSISYRVTVGPRMKPVICASMPNCSMTSVSAATTWSFALVAVLCAGPVLSTSRLGSVYEPRRGIVSCSARRAGASFEITTVSLRAGWPIGTGSVRSGSWAGCSIGWYDVS